MTILISGAPDYFMIMTPGAGDRGTGNTGMNMAMSVITACKSGMVMDMTFSFWPFKQSQHLH
jgi:hypothetical protein